MLRPRPTAPTRMRAMPKTSAADAHHHASTFSKRRCETAVAMTPVTNVRRHARGASIIEVAVDADEGGVRLTVTNDGEVAPVTTPGYGITGMMERASLLGGTCQSGRAPGGGWVVTAVLPRVG